MNFLIKLSTGSPGMNCPLKVSLYKTESPLLENSNEEKNNFRTMESVGYFLG